jgi:DNA-binding CsgD family transcriptional regulator
MQQMLCRELVDRTDELQRLRDLLSWAKAGTGGAAFLLGEAGVGKSRLLYEACQVSRDAGGRVLCGRATATGTRVAYRPIAEALISGLRAQNLPPTAELEPFRPALGQLIPQWRAPTHLTVDTVYLAEGVLRLLRALAAPAKPVVLALEDLHWADTDSLALLEYLCDNIAGEPVAVLGTLRAEPCPARDLVHGLASRRAVALLRMQRLSSSDVERMCRACLGSEPPEAIRQGVATYADGLPFFVEETLAGLLASGELRRTASGWQTTGQLSPVVPVTFAATVHRRMERLGAEAVRALAAAAVLGRRFDADLLPAMTDLDTETVARALQAAAQAQLISDDREDMARFRHALTREAVLAQVHALQRRHLAARALAALQERYPELDGEWCELAADLAEQAGQKTIAAGLLLRLARRARASSALSTAEATLDRARALIRTDDELADSLDEELLEVLVPAARLDRALQLGEALLARLAARPSTADRRARLHLMLARAAATAASDWGLALVHLAKVRQLDMTAGLGAACDAVAAEVALGQYRWADAERFARTAAAAAGTAGDHELTCEGLLLLGRRLRIQHLQAAHTVFSEALELAERHELPLWRIKALLELGTIDFYEVGDTAIWERALDEAYAAGAFGLAANAKLHLTIMHVLRYELDAAERDVVELAGMARRFRLGVLVPAATVMRGQLAAVAGRRQEAETAFGEVFTQFGSDPEWVGHIWGHGRAVGALNAEDRPGALAALDQAITAPGPGTTTVYLGTWALVRVVVGGDDGDDIARRVGARGPFVHVTGGGLLEAALAVQRGRDGDPRAAEELFGQARALLARTPWYHALACRLVAEECLAHGWGQPGEYLSSALCFFTGAGLEAPASACRVLLRAAGQPVPRRNRRSAEVPSGLRTAGVTSREAEVLTLLAQGLSNRQIAARLFLSHRTVEHHIARLLAKTGSANRTALATYAATLDGPAVN